MTKRISVNAGGLWRTSVELEEGATWRDLGKKIEKVTGLRSHHRILEPNGDEHDICELEEDDEVLCTLKLSYDGKHPLHIAAGFEQNTMAIKLWIASGADINVKTGKHGQTPLMIAATELQIENVKELLLLGVNAQLIDDYNRTALHWLADAELRIEINIDELYKQIEKMLIDAGCDPTKRDCLHLTYHQRKKRSDDVRAFWQTAMP